MSERDMSKRRDFISGSLALGGGALASMAITSADASTSLSNNCINVTEAPYSAVGDGVANDTVAFQSALDDAGSLGGGIVFVPTGYYLLDAIEVPRNVTLRGVFEMPPNWKASFTTAENELPQGTTLVASSYTEGVDEAFISLAHHNATVKGLIIYYPGQSKTNPVNYSYTIRGGTPQNQSCDNLSVIDVLLVNSFKGIDFGKYRIGRHLIQRVYGRPISVGIYIDNCQDTGRIEDVHFWPFWAAEPSSGVNGYIANNGVALWLRKSDWQIVNNFFCFGYKIGVKFDKEAEKTNGSGQTYYLGALGGQGTNGQFTNLNIDAANIGIEADYIATQGVTLSNVNIACSSFYGATTRIAITQPQNAQYRGPFTITNGNFWGDFATNIISFAGTNPGVEPGPLRVSNCHFNGWTGVAAISLVSGRASIQGNYFKDLRGKSVYIGSGCDRVIIMGNHFVGNPVENYGSPNLTIIANNL
ncbi:hypothetical protein GCM10008090_20810 [Arenicella chitinivorans]|uniref:Rhamnogalacturonase A/B/Epimerase-like pectate lyase domain-containing protein n=1 Tax=Arenicella chitinivorans TaxID=1329800 RepID=A0A918RSR8_9GAMM|nr:glycosyl hydrolase family 28-related protein [Arenicella chitinivorans]GHA10904.1 hypothetical protein GCM10008090_20810 [Arenicella chitinivorans]